MLQSSFWGSTKFRKNLSWRTNMSISHDRYPLLQNCDTRLNTNLWYLANSKETPYLTTKYAIKFIQIALTLKWIWNNAYIRVALPLTDRNLIVALKWTILINKTSRGMGGHAHDEIMEEVNIFDFIVTVVLVLFIFTALSYFVKTIRGVWVAFSKKTREIKHVEDSWNCWY